MDVTLHNDLNQTVTAVQCDVACNSFHERDTLTPGGNALVSTSTGSVPNWWIITGASGARLGCVDLLYDHWQSGVVVDLSHMQRCPEISGTP